MSFRRRHGALSRLTGAKIQIGIFPWHLTWPKSAAILTGVPDAILAQQRLNAQTLYHKPKIHHLVGGRGGRTKWVTKRDSYIALQGLLSYSLSPPDPPSSPKVQRDNEETGGLAK